MLALAKEPIYLRTIRPPISLARGDTVPFLLVRPTEENLMPTMSDNRRRRIVARQRKIQNAKNRAAKVAKRERNKT